MSSIFLLNYTTSNFKCFLPFKILTTNATIISTTINNYQSLQLYLLYARFTISRKSQPISNLSLYQYLDKLIIRNIILKSTIIITRRGLPLTSQNQVNQSTKVNFIYYLIS